MSESVRWQKDPYTDDAPVYRDGEHIGNVAFVDYHGEIGAELKLDTGEVVDSEADDVEVRP